MILRFNLLPPCSGSVPSMYIGRNILTGTLMTDTQVVDEAYLPFGMNVVDYQWIPRDTFELVEYSAPFRHFHYFRNAGSKLQLLWSVTQYAGLRSANKRFKDTIIHVPNIRGTMTHPQWVADLFTRYMTTKSDRWDIDYQLAMKNLNDLYETVPTVDLLARGDSVNLASACREIDEMPIKHPRMRDRLIEQAYEDTMAPFETMVIAKNSPIISKLDLDGYIDWSELEKHFPKGTVLKKKKDPRWRDVVPPLWDFNPKLNYNTNCLNIFKDIREGHHGKIAAQIIHDLCLAVMEYSNGKDSFCLTFDYDSHMDELKVRSVQRCENLPDGECLDNEVFDKASLNLEKARTVTKALTNYLKLNWVYPLKEYQALTLSKVGTVLAITAKVDASDMIYVLLPLNQIIRTMPCLCFPNVNQQCKDKVACESPIDLRPRDKQKPPEKPAEKPDTKKE